MEIRTRSDIAGSTTFLAFNARERATLERAANIAEQARALCAAAVGGVAEWEGDPQDMELAHVEHGARFLLEGEEAVVISDEIGGALYLRMIAPR